MKAEQTGEKAESMGTKDDVPQNVVWPCKQGGRSARCCVHQALGTASAGYLKIRVSEEGRGGKDAEGD